MILHRNPSEDDRRKRVQIADQSVKSEETLRHVEKLLGRELDGAVAAFRRRPS